MAPPAVPFANSIISGAARTPSPDRFALPRLLRAHTDHRQCYRVCIASIAVCLVLAIVMIWENFAEELMWKAMGTAVAFIVASGVAFGINREFLKPSGQKKQGEPK